MPEALTSVGVLTLLAAIERPGLTGSEPPVIAFTGTIRRQGREAAEAGGTEALGYLLARISCKCPPHEGAQAGSLPAM